MIMKKFIDGVSMFSKAMARFFVVIGVFVGGLIVGILSTLSFLRTEWVSFHPDFFFWTSIITTLLSIGLLCFSIWQYQQAEIERQKGDAQVKIWMQDAKGLHDGLQKMAVDCMTIVGGIVTPKYSSIEDVGKAIYAFSNMTNALYQSLFEERCVTEEEYRARQKEIADEMHKKQIEKIKSGKLG